MNTAELILKSFPYLNEFKSNKYPANFSRFKGDLETLLSNLNPSDYQSEIRSAIESLDAHVRTLPRRKQWDERHKIRQILSLFAVPAALKCGENGTLFAEELFSQWNRKNPKFPFQKGSYEFVMEGFEGQLFGVPLNKEKRTFNIFPF